MNESLMEVDPVSLSTLFSRPSFKRLSSEPDASLPLKSVLGADILRRFTGAHIADVYDYAWQTLKKLYRNEYVFKTEITNRVIFGRHSPNTAALYLELPVGNSIADMAVFNGTSTAYEIKTDLDSAVRLKTQSYDYLKAFEKVYVVVSERSVEKYLKQVDERVGILVLTTRGNLREIKKPLTDSTCFDSETAFRCLHRAEQIDIAEKITNKKIDLPNGVVFDECLQIFKEVNRQQAHKFFMEKMRLRKVDKKTQTFVSSLPYSLRALGYATPLSEKKRGIITNKISEVIS